MFGCVLPNERDLSVEQKARYQGCYCGLCRVLGEKYGGAGRMALAYDMAFLVLLLNSLYEPEESVLSARCGPHPVRRRTAWQSVCTGYAADMNVLLAYYNCLDDWRDERKVTSLVEARLLAGRRVLAERNYPRQAEVIERELQKLRGLEREWNGQAAGGALPDMDAAAKCFGALMAELMIYKEDYWADTLRQLGDALGRFIYILDAYEDVEDDRKKGNYNPLLALVAEPMFTRRCQGILSMLMAACADAFERLPLVQDAELLRNIVYSGVWTRFEAAAKKRAQAEGANAGVTEGVENE